MPAALEVARAIAAHPPLAVQPMEPRLRRALDPDGHERGAGVSSRRGELFRTDDRREGVTAFLEMRALRFPGR